MKNFRQTKMRTTHYQVPPLEIANSRLLRHLFRDREEAPPEMTGLWRRAEEIVMSAATNSRFRAGAKICSGGIMVLLVIGALGPASWTPRTALGWQIDHFLGYFAITLLVSFAWPRPFVVGAVLIAAAFVLGGLQALTPDRTANIVAALCGAGGVLAAALVAEFFIRAWRWHPKSARSA
jgi:VanZ family protein